MGYDGFFEVPPDADDYSAGGVILRQAEIAEQAIGGNIAGSAFGQLPMGSVDDGKDGGFGLMAVQFRIESITQVEIARVGPG